MCKDIVLSLTAIKLSNEDFLQLVKTVYKYRLEL